MSELKAEGFELYASTNSFKEAINYAYGVLPVQAVIKSRNKNDFEIWIKETPLPKPPEPST